MPPPSQWRPGDQPPRTMAPVPLPLMATHEHPGHPPPRTTSLRSPDSNTSLDNYAKEDPPRASSPLCVHDRDCVEEDSDDSITVPPGSSSPTAPRLTLRNRT
eukprot:8834122-Prorocentrum_lima.AAC.1